VSPADALLEQLGTRASGLSSSESVIRLDQYGPSRIDGDRRRRRPGRALLFATLAVVVVTAVLPWTPLRSLLGFVTLDVTFYLSIAAIAISYLMAAEATKRWFFHRERERLEGAGLRS